MNFKSVTALLLTSFIAMSASAAESESSSELTKFMLTGGVGAQLTPVPDSISGFAFFGAELGYLFTPHLLLTGSVGSHPSTGASDNGTKASETFFGLGLKTFFSETGSMNESRENAKWQFYLSAALENRKIEVSRTVNSSSSNRRYIEGTRGSLVAAGGFLKQQGRTLMGIDLVRANIPLFTDVTRDDGGIESYRDNYFKNVNYSICFVYLGIGF